MTVARSDSDRSEWARQAVRHFSVYLFGSERPVDDAAQLRVLADLSDRVTATALAEALLDGGDPLEARRLATNILTVDRTPLDRIARWTASRDAQIIGLVVLRDGDVATVREHLFAFPEPPPTAWDAPARSTTRGCACLASW